MKAKCSVCSEEKELEYAGHGMYQMSKTMEEHKHEGQEVKWTLVDEGAFTGVDGIVRELQERLTETRSDTERELLEKEIARHEEGQRVKEEYNLDDSYINVWDCHATLISKINGVEITDDELMLFLTEKQQEKLDKLIREAVDEQGAINWSGHYYISEKLAKFMQMMLYSKKGYIQLLVTLKKEYEQEKEKLNTKLKESNASLSTARNILYQLARLTLRENVPLDEADFWNHKLGNTLRTEMEKVIQVVFNDNYYLAYKHIKELRETRFELGDTIKTSEGIIGTVSGVMYHPKRGQLSIRKEDGTQIHDITPNSVELIARRLTLLD